MLTFRVRVQQVNISRKLLFDERSKERSSNLRVQEITIQDGGGIVRRIVATSKVRCIYVLLDYLSIFPT